MADHIEPAAYMLVSERIAPSSNVSVSPSAVSCVTFDVEYPVKVLPIRWESPEDKDKLGAGVVMMLPF